MYCATRSEKKHRRNKENMESKVMNMEATRAVGNRRQPVAVNHLARDISHVFSHAKCTFLMELTYPCFML